MAPLRLEELRLRTALGHCAKSIAKKELHEQYNSNATVLKEEIPANAGTGD
jgi:hypothetical protein